METDKQENNVPYNEVMNFKQALYIDTDEEDGLIENYLMTAKDYINGAVGDDVEDFQHDQRYNFAVQMLAQFWYQNRGIDMQNTPYQVVSMIQQLRGEYD